MIKVDEIIKGIQSLSYSDKMHLYKKLKDEILTAQSIPIDLDKYQGIVKNLWCKDAQDFIDKLRANDRCK